MQHHNGDDDDEDSDEYSYKDPDSGEFDYDDERSDDDNNTVAAVAPQAHQDGSAGVRGNDVRFRSIVFARDLEKLYNIMHTAWEQNRQDPIHPMVSAVEAAKGTKRAFLGTMMSSIPSGPPKNIAYQLGYAKRARNVAYPGRKAHAETGAVSLAMDVSTWYQVSHGGERLPKDFEDKLSFALTILLEEYAAPHSLFMHSLFDASMQMCYLSCTTWAVNSVALGSPEAKLLDAISGFKGVLITNSRMRDALRDPRVDVGSLRLWAPDVEPPTQPERITFALGPGHQVTTGAASTVSEWVGL